jgi:hypothetical protein
MANVFGMNIDIAGTMGGMGTGIMYLLLLVLVGLIIYMILDRMKFKHKFRVRVLTGGKILEVDDKAKTVKTREGIIFWKLLKRKDKVPVPPAESISVTGKGKMSVTAYYTEHGQYVYSIPNLGVRVGTDDPLNTTDHEFYLNEVKKAESEKEKKLSEWLMQMAPFIALVIILIMAMSFWGSITKPYLDATNMMEKITENQNSIAIAQAKTMTMINELLLNKQGIQAFNMSTEFPPGLFNMTEASR